MGLGFNSICEPILTLYICASDKIGVPLFTRASEYIPGKLPKATKLDVYLLAYADKSRPSILVHVDDLSLYTCI